MSITVISVAILVGITVLLVPLYSSSKQNHSKSDTAAPTSTSTTIKSWANSLDTVASSRVGKIEGAVLDMSTGTQWQFGGTTPMVTASIIKLTIADTLLSQGKDISQLGKSILDELAPMIEESSNNAATFLWDQVGGSAGIYQFDKEIGLSNTKVSSCVQCPGFPWPGWGLTLSTPSDQIKVLQNIFEPSKWVSSSSQAYLMNLMSNVVPSERWGISSGPDKNSRVWLKNGWLPMSGSGNWQINSVGKVSSPGHQYLIALMSSENPSMAYGIDSIEMVSQKIWELVSSNYRE
jgi:beta-lactamase class A